MGEAIYGPKAFQPTVWTLCFERSAISWASHLALGRYKHVRAFGYVPFLHVWVFYDVGFRGASVVVAADGPDADSIIEFWSRTADLLSVLPAHPFVPRLPVFGWCVPSIRRLIGFRGGALRPDAFYRQCLAQGATPIELDHGSATVPTSAP